LIFENLTLAVFGDKLNTGSVINDPKVCSLMDDVGRRMVDSHLKDPSMDGLFRRSREFSRTVGLESFLVESALDLLEPYGHAGMCMLGHSVFTDVPQDEVFDLFGDVPTYTCSSTDAMPRLL
jgi:pantoate kinase